MKQRRTQLDWVVRLHFAQLAGDVQQAGLAQHFAIGIAGFDQRIGVTEDAVSRFELDVELLILRDVEDA